MNTITIQGNNGKGSSGRVSYSDTRNSWITPNSGYNRQVVSASFTSQVSKWINLGVRATYNRKQSDNLPMSGYSRATIPGSLVWLSPNVDINWLKDYEKIAEENDYKRNNQFYSVADSPYL
ncbi:MAG: SusC/RagA family TonB-linked outer membrane protein, partial [Candidatus Cryptobacteroides sp.]